MMNKQNDPKIHLFFNTFVDINYLSPLIIFGEKYNSKFNLIFYFEDLKKKYKIYFNEKKNEILSFPFMSNIPVFVADSKKQLHQYLKKQSGVFITSSQSLCNLKKHHLLKKQMFFKTLNYVAITYFNEGVGQICRIADSIFFNSPSESSHYPNCTIQYGNPYWDLFGSGRKKIAAYDNTDINPQKNNIVIPEIIKDGNSWFDSCIQYIKEHQSNNNVFYIKHRLKTIEHNNQQDIFEEKVSKYDNIKHIYSPFFFTTVNLLTHCNEVVFTSNASLFIMDCMAAGIKTTNYYKNARKDIWKVKEYRSACDNYAEFPEKTKKELLYSFDGNNTLNLLKRVSNFL